LIFNINHSYPELQIRGCEEYQTRLDEAVIAAIQGLKKPEAALKEVEQQWEDITERYGRKQQKEAWKFVTSSMFGEDLRKAMNLGNPPPIVGELHSARWSLKGTGWWRTNRFSPPKIFRILH